MKVNISSYDSSSSSVWFGWLAGHNFLKGMYRFRREATFTFYSSDLPFEISLVIESLSVIAPPSTLG